ncbi:MAG: NAD(P)/FAD-dependent oxidoreductase [Nitrospirae bacterium]|nr:NAD(P)/FAD-dependent oxidoreductase [Nitrospirota bacterium]
MKTSERLIVIGNGMAGVATVEHLLARRSDVAVTIFGSEPHINYNRVLLSSVLAGEAGFEDIILNPLAWYEQHGIELHLNATVSRIDLNGKSIITEKGNPYPFDKLLIATGSIPFIPPIKGIQTDGVLIPGVFTFRNIEDTQSMIHWAQKSRKAIVIGGGLLGIEAAGGLIRQGVDVTIVHLVDRLMEMQVDAAGSEILKREVSRLGIQVVLGSCADEVITGNGLLEALHFTDGSVREADMIVIATGIRPNVHLSKDAGLSVNRGILVNDAMQTSHPDIYAVGECVEHRGTIYGIVAPLMEQARVAAEAIAGGTGIRYEGSVVATKLKVAGIPLASIGNIQGKIGCEEIVYSDPGAAIYKKLVISGGRMVGAILLGDLDGYSRYLGHIQHQEDISLQRKTLLTGQPQGAASIASMPDEAVICGCKGISKGTIINAIEEHQLTSIKEVSEKTRACTSCKGCAPLIEQILQEVLGGEYVKQDRPSHLCDCIPMVWEDIREEVIARGLKSVNTILTAVGNGIGCDTCRPALSYMLTELYIDAYEKEFDALLVNDQFHANIQKDGTFSVVPRIYGGVTTPEQLRRIADVAEKYQVPMVKITGSQRIDLLGIPGERLPSVWTELGMSSGHAYTKDVRTCKTCVGDAFCRFGVQDSTTLGILMEIKFQGIPCPGKIKMAVSGCPRNCAEAGIKDIGVVGIQTGWEIYVGGNGGVKPRIADLLTTVKTREEVLDVTGLFIQYYRENARWQERTSHFIERVGIDHVREVLLKDKLGIAGRLRERINEVAAAYKDPWAESLTGC